MLFFCEDKTVMIMFIKNHLLNTFIFILFICSLTACNDCSDSGYSELRINSSIFISAIALNSDAFQLFGISDIGNNLTMISPCRAFASASLDGKMAILQKVYSKDFVIFTYNLITGELQQVTPDNYYHNISYAAISADSRNIAFVNADTLLFLAKSNGTYAEPLTNKLCRYSEPAFSKDGKYIAFFEGSFNGGLRLKILDCSNTSNYIVNDFIGFADKPQSIAKIDWNFQNSSIIYNINYNNTTSMIISRNIFNNHIDTIVVKNLGSENPVIDYNSENIAFEAKDGNVWYLNKTDKNNLLFKQISSVYTNEKAVFPEWSNDSQKLIYVIGNSNIGTNKRLYLYDIKSKTSSFLFANVDRAFWNRM